MELYDAIYSRRSIRKFTRTQVAPEKLLRLVDSARLAPSCANLQPLRYAVIADAEAVKKTFSHTRWAGYEPSAGPLPSEAPTAYIAVIGDSSVNERILQNDSGLAMANICLAAVAEGLGSCILGSVDRKAVSKLIGIGDGYDLLYLVALGYPAQESRAVEAEGDDIKYYLEGDKLLVPKRKMSDIIIKERSQK